jgi:hypothetical protein
LPKDGKRMNPLQIFGVLAVRELAYRLRYRSFGSLMPGCHYAEFRGTTESDIAGGVSETMKFLTFLMKINRSPMKRIEMMSE